MLKFATFTSDIELPFYTSLASHKIDYDKLDDSARRLLGLYEIRSKDKPEASCRLQVHGNALTNDALVQPQSLDAKWMLTVNFQRAVRLISCRRHDKECEHYRGL